MYSTYLIIERMSLGWVDTHHFSLVKDFEVNQTQRESTRIDLHDFHIFTSFYFLVSRIPYLINLTLFHPLLRRFHRFYTMPFLFVFTALDTSLGRVNRDTLSDQDRLELFAAEAAVFTEIPIEDPQRGFTDCCSWSFVNCDEEGNVFGISSLNEISSDVSLEILPSRISSIFIWSDLCTIAAMGSCETRLLPPQLKVLIIADNAFYGTFDMTAMPKTLKICSIRENQFEGKCDLRCLPHGLESLMAGCNRFSGDLVLDGLPESLKTLGVEKNGLSGDISLAHLAEGLETIDIGHNQFSGSFAIQNPPKSLTELLASGNRFSGTAIIKDSLDLTVRLRENPIRTVLDECGHVHSQMQKILGRTSKNASSKRNTSR